MSQDEIVEKVRAIWAEALQVSVTDTTDFFWMGGHSFMAIDIITQTEDALQIKVPLRMLFDNPRFDDFVTAIQDHICAEENSSK